MMLKPYLGLVVLLALTACDDDNSSGDESPAPDAVSGADGSPPVDGNVDANIDGHVDGDGRLPDAARPSRDAEATGTDAEPPVSDAAAAQPDGAPLDAGPPSPDAVSLDSPPADAQPVDLALPDTARPDVAVPDAMRPDVEPPFIWPDDRPAGQCSDANDCPSGLCQRNPPGGICMAGGGCPEGTMNSMTGACNRQCEADQLCPVGLICRRGFDGEWFCGIPSCDHDEDCEGPYVCRDDFCGRPACSGETPCPAQMRCSGGLCMEPE